MAQKQRFGWSMAASVLAVMVLVFAALVSSWLGLDAEARGRATLEQAAQLERDVADARVLAATVAALRAELALDALRGEAMDPRNRRVAAYQDALEALRAALARLGGATLLERERVLLAAAQQAIERFVRIATEGAGGPRSGPRPAQLRAASAQRDAARLLADQAIVQIRALEQQVAGRAAEAAEDADESARRARVLLIVFGGSSLLLALVLARTLSESIARRAELLGQLAELARVDSLTGVANRRAWDDELARGLERARRTGKPCTVALIDLDHFKRFNDTHGHQRGDALLRTAAQAFAARLRNDDLIARYGGEEFAVLLHGCGLDSALQLFERLQGMLPAGQTFSAGVADSDGKEESLAVVARADAALYRAKGQGRNRTLGAPRPA
ncbi:MAG TPA: GGDEF domain-containing protein [Burkholderiales bacterium]|nr:GGDEF domain-containing protein [Burkholderiales bacterium]